MRAGPPVPAGGEAGWAMDPGAGFLVPGSGRRDRGCGRSAEVATDPPIGPARRGHLPKDSSLYPLARVKAFVPDPLPWSCLAGGRAASSASGAVLDGTGGASPSVPVGVSLLTGAPVAE